MAPIPADGPSKVRRSAGSIFSHGDHAPHLRRSFTWANTASAGAEIVADRVTRKSAGRVATTMTNNKTTTARAMRMFEIIDFRFMRHFFDDRTPRFRTLSDKFSVDLIPFSSPGLRQVGGKLFERSTPAPLHSFV